MSIGASSGLVNHQQETARRGASPKEKGRGEGVGTLSIPGRSRMVPALGGSRRLLREQPESGGIDGPQPGPLVKYRALRSVVGLGTLTLASQFSQRDRLEPRRSPSPASGRGTSKSVTGSESVNPTCRWRAPLLFRGYSPLDGGRLDLFHPASELFRHRYRSRSARPPGLP